MILNHWTRGRSSAKSSLAAVLVPIVVMAAITCGALTASAARRAKSAAKPETTGTNATVKTPPTGTTSAKAAKARPRKIGAFNPADETVELFKAVENGDLKVKLIPKDSTQGRVFIQNKTKKPLNVKLPEAFAAVPILAQMGGGQGMGGGMGGGGMGGGGMFNVPAEKEVNLKVACMCLEHGKPEPRAAMTYKLVPIEEFTDKPGVKQLCTMLGNGQIPQRAAQVAAWHLNNDMSWNELAAKKIVQLSGDSEPYFTDEELATAVSIVSAATSKVEEKPAIEKIPSPGETARGE